MISASFQLTFGQHDPIMGVLAAGIAIVVAWQTPSEFGLPTSHVS